MMASCECERRGEVSGEKPNSRRDETNDVYVADLVEPEAVDVVGGLHEVALAKVGVDVGSGRVELL